MKKSFINVLPVFFGFFVMGFVDIVGISTNYVKHDFALNDTLANLLPMMVFLWFALLSVPVGLLMNKIGRKKTVIISMLITGIALFIPLVYYNFTFVLITFALLGIGNTIIQVSLNPLVTNIISSDKIASSLTLGQFIKAIASFIGPISAAFAMAKFGNWKLIFPVYSLISIVSSIWLATVKVEKEQIKENNTSFSACFGLLKNWYILLLFIGILMIVGLDVGMNTSIPKLLMAKCNLPLNQAGLGTSLYFAARTIGAFIGAIILIKIPIRRVFTFSMVLSILAFILLISTSNLWLILTSTFLIGLACANVFSMIFTLAIHHKPESTNEISGLMIMGVAGGAIILPLMGLLTDRFGLIGGMLLLLLCLVYVFISSIIFYLYKS